MDSIVKQELREITPLSADDLIATAASRVLETDLPALPAVHDDGSFAGIFGEREFMRALFPGYFDELGSSRMISRSMDEAIERRLECASEPISRYLTREAVVVEDDYSDTHLAELFLHHRVLIIPIATRGRIHALVTRHDFFRGLVSRFAARSEEIDETS